MTVVPFASFKPDMNRFNAGALPTVLNVVPASDGWRPLKAIVPTPAVYDYITYDEGERLTFDNGDRIVIAADWSEITGLLTLPDECTGLFAARKRDGTETLFAGTATALYRFNRSVFVWEDVSSTTYASACRWSFAQFGTVVYAQNGADTEQMFDVETDSLFSDNATAPICKYIAVVKNFMFRGNIVSWASQSISDQPSMIQCSALEDPTDNEPQNFNFSDYQALPTGDEIMGIVPVTGGCHIWMKNALYALSLTISDYTFTTTPLDEMRGTTAPYSIGVFGTDQYLIYADDGFWLFAGGGFSPVGQDSINRWFLANCDQDERDNILACPDPENTVIWLAYTNINGEREMIGFHYILKEWTRSDIALTASARARTFTYTESDPPIIIEDLPRFAIMDQNAQLGYLAGNPLAATLVTNEVAFSQDRAFIENVRLIGDPQTYTVTPSTTDVRGGLFRRRSASQPSSRSGHVAMRADGRTHLFELVIPSDEDWTTVGALDVDVKASSGK